MYNYTGMYGGLFLIVLGHIVIHGIILLSIFDVYFTTLVVPNVVPIQWSSIPQADRVVLFVADGLTADKLFDLDEKNSTRSPYITDIIRHNGTWGLSYTRAPTESRPAHVAMLGGFWEDPSGLKVGWKYNPVEFDTVFNESRETWAWGADDVLPYFNKGSAAAHVHIDTHHYHESNLADLDIWVFKRVESFLNEAKSNVALRKRLLENRIVFFLHLAGIDSNGHRHHPASSFYLENIRVVDKGIKDTVTAFEKFYGNDAKTAFLFTGDHGMTDEGGHGGDSPAELRTPFVAWGSGIAHLSHSSGNLQSSLSNDELEVTKNWGLDPGTRVDLSQTDISVLMASLIGVPYPVNSVGSLPLAYLQSENSSTAEQVYGRAKQMTETFLTKGSVVMKKEFHISFWEYKRDEKEHIQKCKKEIELFIKDKKYKFAIEKSQQLFQFSRQGLQYYHSYHNFFPQACVVLSLLGWIVFVFTFVLQEKGLGKISMVAGHSRNYIKYAGLFVLIYISLAVRVYQFDASWMYYLYALLPISVWFVIFTHIRSPDMLCNQTTTEIVKAAIACAAWLCILIAGFYQREIFGICIGLLALAPFLRTRLRNTNIVLIVIWTTLCICLTVFPMLPEVVRGSTRKELVLFGGIFASVFCTSAKIFHTRQTGKKAHRSSLFHVASSASVVLPALTGFIGYFSSSGSSIQCGKIIMIMGWMVPFFGSAEPFQRLFTINIWQLSAYVLVSESHDVLFYVILTVMLHVWVILEVKDMEAATDYLPSNYESESGTLGRTKKIRSCIQDLRRASILLFFLAIGFFGIFSVESMNHFHVRVLPFLPVTDTFSLIVLYIYKLCLHYLAIGAAFCALAELIQLPLKVTWYITVCLSDLMLIYFYFAVRDSGSWAQIGFSIANLLIVAGLPIGLLFIFFVGKLMISVRLPQTFQLF